jgi:hypothetical protein
MKKIILALSLASGHTLMYGMNTLHSFSPRSRSKTKDIAQTPQSIIIKEALNAASAPELLLVINRAKIGYKLTESEIATYAITQKKHTNQHLRLFIQVKRIEAYNQKIEKENLLCPVIHLRDNFDTTMSLYKKYREARLWANQCDIPITKSQQHQATAYPIEISPSIGFEEFVNFEIDFNNLSHYSNSWAWNDIVAMLTAQPSNTTPTQSLITLDDDNQ